MAPSRNTPEAIVRDIKRKTRGVFNAEEKIRIILEVLGGGVESEEPGVKKKLNGFGIKLGSSMKYCAEEKYEIITARGGFLVECTKDSEANRGE